jgi:hypothetical protein
VFSRVYVPFSTEEVRWLTVRMRPVILLTRKFQSSRCSRMNSTSYTEDAGLPRATL